MKTKSRKYSMESAYRELQYSRQSQGYSQESKEKQAKDCLEILELVRGWRGLHPGMGARQLHYTMRNAHVDLRIGINKFEQLLSKSGLNVLKTYTRWPKTSDGKGKEDYPNLTHGLVLNDINQLVVGDITYIWVEDCWHYIFTLKDVYSQKIISLLPARNMEQKHAIDCINEAIKLRGAPALSGCIHHTDNGSQYNALAYKKIIKDHNMQVSRAKSCKENGSAEQLNHVAKNMYLKYWEVKTFSQLEQKCRDVKELHNEQRAIEQLGNVSPNQFEQIIKNLKPEDRPQKTMHDFNKFKK